MLAKASIQSWHCASVAMIAPPARWMAGTGSSLATGTHSNISTGWSAAKSLSAFTAKARTWCDTSVATGPCGPSVKGLG